jgi:maltose O-acetyltransferase
VAKLTKVIREELSGLHLRLFLARVLLAPLPIHVGSRLRVYVLRLAGFQIGHGCVIWGLPTITGNSDLYSNLAIGRECLVNVQCFFDLGAPITIGDRAALGHQVVVLTTSHHVGQPGRRAGAAYTKPVTIGEGAWLGARCTIFPGVNIGTGAVVAAGAIVNQDVPPNTLVAGIPARVMKTLL